jgi:hypothetical protein
MSFTCFNLITYWNSLQKNIVIKMEMVCIYPPDTCIEHNILYLLRTNLEHVIKMVADLELHTRLDQYPWELGLKVIQRSQGREQLESEMHACLV